MHYKQVVEIINSIEWHKLDRNGLACLMYLSHVAAMEFAESLRIALDLYPYDTALKLMAEGELKTHNLVFGDYDQPGDHSEFLQYFLIKAKILQRESLLATSVIYVPNRESIPEAVETAGDEYMRKVDELSKEDRAMSVFSREHELPGIFKNILKNPLFDSVENDELLAAFKYYLEKHIELDGGDGGHDELVQKYPVTDDVVPFYMARLDMYQPIIN